MTSKNYCVIRERKNLKHKQRGLIAKIAEVGFACNYLSDDKDNKSINVDSDIKLLGSNTAFVL